MNTPHPKTNRFTLTDFSGSNKENPSHPSKLSREDQLKLWK
jgi:hypothetical protein